MGEEKDHDETECGPADSSHESMLMADHLSTFDRAGESLATTIARNFEMPRMPGLEAISERVSAAAESWMTANGPFSSGLTHLGGPADIAGLLSSSDHLGQFAMGSAGSAITDLFGKAMLGPAESLATTIARNFEMPRMPGLEAINAQVSAAAESWMTAAMRWPMPDVTAWMNEVMRGPAESIAATMRSWSTLADGGLWAARLALRMALAAKRAVMRGDIAAVRRFLCDWLGFQLAFVTHDLVNSASLVLLDDQAWLPDDTLALDYDPCRKLRKLTLAEHRRCTRLITDPRRRAHRQPVLPLDKPITKSGPDEPTITLLELVAAKPQPELVASDDDISDPRVLHVLAKLSDRERKIADERGHVGTTWAEAAVACGGTTEEGEKLRRKVKRLSKPAGVQRGQPGDTAAPDTRAVG